MIEVIIFHNVHFDTTHFISMTALLHQIDKYNFTI